MDRDPEMKSGTGTVVFLVSLKLYDGTTGYSAGVVFDPVSASVGLVILLQTLIKNYDW